MILLQGFVEFDKEGKKEPIVHCPCGNTFEVEGKPDGFVCPKCHTAVMDWVMKMENMKKFVWGPEEKAMVPKPAPKPKSSLEEPCEHMKALESYLETSGLNRGGHTRLKARVERG